MRQALPPTPAREFLLGAACCAAFELLTSSYLVKALVRFKRTSTTRDRDSRDSALLPRAAFGTAALDGVARNLKTAAFVG